jgi:hypothetical protein
VIGSTVSRLSRCVAQWRSRFGALVEKCRPLAERLRPLLVRLRALVLRVHGRVREKLDPEPRVRALAAAAGAGAVAILSTGTCTDTGLWFRQGRVGAACAGGALFLLALGRRPHVERIPFAELGESMYNAFTGEVLLAPAPSAAIRRLRMDPVAGRHLIECVVKKGEL